MELFVYHPFLLPSHHHEQIIVYQVDNSVHFQWISSKRTALEITPPLAPPPSCESCTFAQLMSSNENAKWRQPTTENDKSLIVHTLIKMKRSETRSTSYTDELQCVYRRKKYMYST